MVRQVSQGLPVPGMVLCTGLTERGPKDPEVETWRETEANSKQLALWGYTSQNATPYTFRSECAGSQADLSTSEAPTDISIHSLA